jgi:hypothetical protein
VKARKMTNPGRTENLVARTPHTPAARSPSEKKLPFGANRRRRRKRPTASPTDARTMRTV